ncbi:MAG: proline--tRNA ligase [Nanoarchaeota archaeon]|nr:proline--tRNA ligase [Nanoarchaeota archaeon]MBU1050924.1 proline--tRNA ligase [Nanoarchaeota archaeon]
MVKKDVKGDEKSVKGLTVSKKGNFSKWFSEIVQKAELGDLRYNVKGFLVFQPWSVFCMEKMYSYFEKTLQRKGHEPYFFPTLIPEENFKKEAGHVAGFTPEVFWVTHGGETKFNEKLALRPTSETAFYQMFSLWIRSYNDLPFKTYQRANVFRYETKATRPFLRSREFHWIETHCAFASEKDAMKQVHEDMDTTKEILHDIFGLPFIFFERPQWDTFPGAEKTFATDVLNPDGRVVQQPSTHFIKHDFAEAFDIKFKDKDGKDKYVYTTCYGPAMSRIFASVVIVHGDDKGLRFPWEIAPKHVAIVPIDTSKELVKKAEQLKEKIGDFADVVIDTSNKTPGEKFNHWEMKGIPVRIDIGKKEMKGKKLSVFRRDLNKKETIAENDLMNYLEKVKKESGKNLINQADDLFSNRIVNVSNIDEMNKAIAKGNIARCGFCSINRDGEKCAEVVEKDVGAKVRGVNLKKETPKGMCAVCDKKAKHVVYIAKDY